jgi:hypothetical protein
MFKDDVDALVAACTTRSVVEDGDYQDVERAKARLMDRHEHGLAVMIAAEKELAAISAQLAQRVVSAPTSASWDAARKKAAANDRGECTCSDGTCGVCTAKLAVADAGDEELAIRRAIWELVEFVTEDGYDPKGHQKETSAKVKALVARIRPVTEEPLTAKMLWPRLNHCRVRFDDGTIPPGWEAFVVLTEQSLADALDAVKGVG